MDYNHIVEVKSGTMPELHNTQQEPHKFITSFNNTMLKIWQEQITLLYRLWAAAQIPQVRTDNG